MLCFNVLLLTEQTAEERLERALGDCFFAQEKVPLKETFAIQLLLDGLEVEVPREQEAEQPSPKMIVGLNPRQREIKRYLAAYFRYFLLYVCFSRLLKNVYIFHKPRKANH